MTLLQRASPQPSRLGLRSMITIAMALIASLAIASALALMGLTTMIRSAGEERAAALRSLQIIEAAEVDLLLHARAADGAVRAAHQAELLRRLGQAAEHITSSEEQELLSSVRRGVDTYLRVSRDRAASDPGEALTAAFASLEALLEVNARQSDDAGARAEDAGRLANVVGVTSLAAVLAVVGVVCWWLWRHALAPTLELGAVMRRFGAGERGARARVEGAAELRGMAERFNEMAGELTRRREAQMTFLAGVAHDLRNPLAPLKTAVTVLTRNDRPGSKQNAALLRVLERQVDHLDRLIGDLLEIARAEAGRLDLRLQEVDARSLAEEAVELFRPAAPRVEFELSTPPFPVTLSCDPIRVQQVLNNLISNAIKYSPDGGHVAVVVERDGERVTFSVRDRGFGIAREDLDRVFEPFRRAERSADSAVPGEGLGLFVARRIVEAHSGRLEVSSVEGEGSTFRMELPTGVTENIAEMSFEAGAH